jgi:hypothetical protein
MREPGIYSDVDIDEYHAEEGLSSTGVSLILDCPKRYWAEYLAGGKKSPEDQKFSLGRALHMAVLEPEKFEAAFLVMKEDVDLRTKAGKEVWEKAQAYANGRTILRAHDGETVVNMANAVKNHSFWQKMPDRLVEQSVYWDRGIFNTRLKARPDAYNDKIIVDLKTTDSIPAFQKSVYSYGYHRQAAMQIDGLEAIDGQRRYHVFFVVEKKFPFFTGVFSLCDTSLNKGRDEYLEAAITYRDCMVHNEWPGYEEKVQQISLPNWAMKTEEEII